MKTETYSPRFWWGLALALSILLLMAYGYVYEAQPFSGYWNDFAANLFTFLGAAFTAVAALLIMSGHVREDAGFRVWLYFSIGFVLWALAEFVWGYMKLRLDEVPTPSAADYLWLAGYFFFGLGFLRQYRILFSAPYWRDLLTLIGIWVVVLLITRAVQFSFGEPGFGNFIDLFYPIGDLAVCIMALRVAWIFGRGVMARPWLALFVLGLADGLYAWLAEGGNYSFTLQNSNLMTLFVDSLYLISYLVLGLGFLAQYFVLRYGPWAFRAQKPGTA